MTCPEGGVEARKAALDLEATVQQPAAELLDSVVLLEGKLGVSMDVEAEASQLRFQLCDYCQCSVVQRCSYGQLP